MGKQRDIADSAAVINYLDGTTSSVQTQLDAKGGGTLGTLTKTFTADEIATITLTDSVLVPIVSVTKEVVQSTVTNNSWDVNSTTENYTRVNSAPATTLDFVGFDVSTATYSQNFSVSAQEANPRAIAFNTNGTKMFIVGSDGDDVNEYTLGTGFDVSTASFVDSFSVSAQDINPKGIAFNTDGTKMFIVGASGIDVNEYTLSTGFDVSTASYSQNFSVASQESNPAGIAFNTNGTKMFILGYGGDDVNEYTLSTGFDVSTATFVDSFSVSAQDSVPISLAFNNDGTKMFILGNVGQDVNEYTLSTGFDVSTASYSQNFSISAQETGPQGIAFNTDGTKMFIVGIAGDDVNEYDLDISLALGTGSFTSADVGKTIYANSGVFVLTAANGSYIETTAPTSYDQVASGSWEMYAVVYNSTDGDLELSNTTVGFDVYIASGYNAVHTTTSTDSTYWTDINSMTADESAGDGSVYYAVSTDDRTTWTIIHNTNGERDIVRNSSGTWQYNSNGTYASETWTNATTNTELSALEEAVETALISNTFDVSTASYSQSFSVSTEDSSPAGIAFNTNGTKMFIVGNSGDDVNEYTLSTGFDVSTATYSQNFSVASQETTPTGIAFNTDGTKMFIIGDAGNDVNEYTLSTGFDVSTASYSQNFSVATQEFEPQSIAFNTNGTKMFIVGTAGNAAPVTQKVNEYTLSTGFDVSTASYSQNFSVSTQETTPLGIAFNTDGTKMFIVGYTSFDVNEYTLSTGFDVSTASYSQAFALDSESTYPAGIAFNTDGSKMFVTGFVSPKVNEYSIGSSTYTNRMNKTQLEAVTDANHFTLGNDLDLAIIFNLSSGSTVPSSDGVSINYDANVLNKGAILGTDYDFDAPAQDKVRITALASNNLKIRVL